ncbi:hypothetical protein D3C73_747890 [compost metagenome]
MNGINQVGVDLFGDIVSVEGHFQHRRILAHSRVEDIFVNVRAQCCCNGVFLLAIRFIDCFERIFAHLAVRAFQELNVASVRQIYFLAFLVLDLRELEVGIVEHAEHGLRGLGQRADLCKECFLRFGQDMRFLTLHFFQGEGVIREGSVGYELVQLLIGQGQNLRCDKRSSFSGLHSKLLCFLGEGLIGWGRRIFILAHMRVDIQALGQQGQLVVQFEALFECIG